MAKVVKDSLQSLLTGEQLPPLPEFRADMTLEEYENFQVEWKRKLMTYLRKLMQKLTGPNIFNELIQQLTPDQLAQLGTIGLQGFGPLTLELYADYTFVDGTTPFGGTLVGKMQTNGLTFGTINGGFFLPENDATSGLSRAIRIKGRITPNFTETYKFHLQHDDGARLYLNGVLAIDKWGGTGSDDTAEFAATAGTSIQFILEMHNGDGDGMTVKLQWGSTSETGGEGDVQDIPFSSLSAY